MSEMRISDILTYSIKIEHESMLFYREAAPRASGGDVRTLLEELAAEEVKHENRLSGLLNDLADGDAEGFDHTSMNKLIRNDEIPADADQEAVLNIALEREENTRDFYIQVATMTNLDVDVVDVFDMLYKQESGHVTRISNMLKKL